MLTTAWLACGGLGVTQAVGAARASAQTVVASTTPASAAWIVHEVLPGELLSSIADRYAVSTRSLARWNKLDPAHPSYRAGQKLRVYTPLTSHVPERLSYEVRKGDSWAKIADRFGVPQRDLQKRWNRRAGTLQVGETLTIWVEGKIKADEEAARASELAVIDVPGVAQSVGTPDRGHLVNGVQLPENDKLYTIRDPKRSFASSHTIEVLQRGIADFRAQTGFSRQILIADMSVEDGGRFGPHHSHRSGRDVDIGLPLRADPPPGSKPGAAVRVDWTATWRLIKAFAATGETRYIFLSRSRQALLYRAAKADGASQAELSQLMQFPRHSRTALVRHAHGHTSHMHVRFRCGAQETACQEI